MSLISKIRRRGVVYSIVIAFNRLMPVWLFRYTVIDVLEIDTDQVAQSSFGNIDSFQQMLTVEERQNLRELTLVGDVDCHAEFPLGFSLKRENAGAEELIGGLWIGEREHYEPSFGFKYSLPENAGWLFAAMLKKECRGKGDYKKLLVYAIRKAQEQGKTSIFLAVSPCHKAAVHAHGKFSRRKVGRLFGFKFFNWAWLSSSGGLETFRSWTFNCKVNPNFLQVHPDTSDSLISAVEGIEQGSLDQWRVAQIAN